MNGRTEMIGLFDVNLAWCPEDCGFHSSPVCFKYLIAASKPCQALESVVQPFYNVVFLATFCRCAFVKFYYGKLIAACICIKYEVRVYFFIS